jgi:hypothetical protein
MIPQAPGGIAPATDPLDLAREADGSRAFPCGIIQGYPLFEVSLRWGKHSEVEQGLSQCNIDPPQTSHGLVSRSHG